MTLISLYFFLLSYLTLKYSFFFGSTNFFFQNLPRTFYFPKVPKGKRIFSSFEFSLKSTKLYLLTQQIKYNLCVVIKVNYYP